MPNKEQKLAIANVWKMNATIVRQLEDSNIQWPKKQYTNWISAANTLPNTVQTNVQFTFKSGQQEIHRAPTHKMDMA